MSEVEAPDLGTNLCVGHSMDCKTLNAKYYQDLFEEISSTAERVRESLYGWVLEADVDFAEKMDCCLDRIPLVGYNSELLGILAGIQKLTRDSKLSDDEKLQFWAPIAECYMQVQGVLADRIVPLKYRQLVKVGDTITVPVKVLSYEIETGFDRFKYALQRSSEQGHECPCELEYLEFEEGYLRGLSREIRERLASEKITHLPLKIVSAEYGMPTFAEIDEEVFMRE
ncbi:MAG: hypothetical protein ABID64_01025 [Nitrospirota bacterium]